MKSIKELKQDIKRMKAGEISTKDIILNAQYPSNTKMWLWSNPSIAHWQRLLFGVIYLPILFWWWLVGNPICLMKDE